MARVVYSAWSSSGVMSAMSGMDMPLVRSFSLEWDIMNYIWC